MTVRPLFLATILGMGAVLASNASAQPFTIEYRPIDGGGNNLAQPDWGRAGTPLARRIPSTYADGLSAPAGPDRPNPRLVSNLVVAQGTSIPATADASAFVFQWGQFLDHDLDLVNPANPAEPLGVPVPASDPFFDPSGTGTVVLPFTRSAYEAAAGGPREQVNAVTAFIDASQVYGSDPTRAAVLVKRNGVMRTSAKGLPMLNRRGLANGGGFSPTFFLCGDVRANEQVGLTALHALFVREHNRLLRVIRKRGWLSRNADGREGWELARAVVGAEMQAITYREFLPVLLGPGALSPYAGYDADVDPRVSNLFAAASYRFGHSMVPPELLRLQADGAAIGAGPLPLRDAFFAPDVLRRDGVEPLLRGLAVQRPQEIDVFVVDDLRNFLFGFPTAGGMDLVTLNIQRGRDHGLPTYNGARLGMGLPPAVTFADITNRPDVQASLAAAYGSVDEIDAWVGGLAEDHYGGAMVGELVFHVLKDQFERLRDGDRLWYQRALPPELVAFVESRTLAGIIRDNTRVHGELRDDVFRAE